MARIAMLLGNEFEDSEFTVPRDRLAAAGHEVVIVGRRAGETVRGKRGEATATVAEAAEGLAADSFGALVIPGGHSPDALRTDEGVVDFVRRFARTGRPIAAVCHGPQLLIEAGLVRGRALTSWPSVRTDLLNAGARWEDREVVVDGNLITSRKPDDLPAFSRTLIDRLGAGGVTIGPASDGTGMSCASG
ncbi:MAG TPA: type 1 glutamine amidotransferase domain-containing protein [Planctomycetota bacterium]|nr:type 1 glutamine amidotransferase domain-containing protein [Planctomycetota bacterium]